MKTETKHTESKWIGQRNWFGHKFGLMGVSNDGMMITPNGKELINLGWLSWKIQRLQHWLVFKTFKN